MEVPTLHSAVSSGDLEAVLVHVIQDSDLNVKEPVYGRTPLHVACDLGHTDIVKALIKARCEVDATDNDGDTPLLQVIANDGDVEIVRLLIEAGADPAARCHLGFTALCQALFVPVNREDNARIIQEENSSQNIVVEDSDLEKFKLLHQAGADINAKDNDGRTPLHVAAILPNEEVVRILIDAGASVNEQDADGNTPLHVAVQFKNKLTVKLLLENDADINFKNQDEFTPFAYAVVNRRCQLHDSKKADSSILEEESDVSLGAGDEETLELEILNLFIRHVKEKTLEEKSTLLLGRRSSGGTFMIFLYFATFVTAVLLSVYTMQSLEE